jgi:hypothetical protein
MEQTGEFKFKCPIHGTAEGVRISAVDLVMIQEYDEKTKTSKQVPSEEEIKVSIECETCPEHLATNIFLPSECLARWNLPVVGTNIYAPLRDHLKDLNKGEGKGEEEA